MPWELAGLWNAWINKGTGEVFESYTMLTLNPDAHAQAGPKAATRPAGKA